MDKERLDYFFTALDFHLRQGSDPKEALQKTVNEYAFVFFTDDGRLPLSRAAEVALKHLEEIGELP